MTMLCPRCMAPLLVSEDGANAACPQDGGEHRVLFQRGVTPVMSAAPEPAAVGIAPAVMMAAPVAPIAPVIPMAAVAPAAPVVPIAPVAFGAVPPPLPTLPWSSPPAPDPYIRVPAPPLAPTTIMCRVHPEMPAVAYCRACGKPSCTTCDFAFPGGLHLCPDCATAPSQGLNSSRRLLVGWAYALAGWSTVATVLVMFGAFTPTSRTDRMAYGIMVFIFVLIPTVLGTLLAYASMEKRLGNPGSVWGAVIWNSVLMGFYILRIIFFTLMGGGL